MKVFERDGKINFVDENNVVLGYDLRQDCCERAGWFISDTPRETIIENNDTVTNLDGYVFDTNYFRETGGGLEFDGGGMAIFRIFHVDGEGRERFIHIYNSHNGYYSHGFQLSVGGVVVKDQSL